MPFPFDTNPQTLQQTQNQLQNQNATRIGRIPLTISQPTTPAPHNPPLFPSSAAVCTAIAPYFTNPRASPFDFDAKIKIRLHSMGR